MSDDRILVDGIAVERLPNGAIKLTGNDRWGKPLDTTFENAEFLRNALPVLSRGLTAAQVMRLQSIARADAPKLRREH